MKTKTVIISGVTITALATTAGAYSSYKINYLKQYNNELKAQLEDAERSIYNTKQTVYKEILEINRKNVNLLVYEAQSKGYTKTIVHDSFIPVEMTLNTKYSYQAIIDLKDVEVYPSNDRYIITVDLSTIELSDINIEPADISYDLNMFNRWKGQTISDMTSSIIMQSSEDIEKHVKLDYKSKQDLIQSRAKDKITQLYKGLPVDVVFVGGK